MTKFGRPWTLEDFDEKPAKMKEQIRAEFEKGNDEEVNKNKYHAKRCEASEDSWPELAGRSFPSKLERATANLLVIRQRAKEIKDLEFQPRVRLLEHPDLNYKPDFRYFDIERKQLYHVESKGFVGERWRVIRVVWAHFGPTPLEIMVAGKYGPRVQKTLWPKG